MGNISVYPKVIYDFSYLYAFKQQSYLIVFIHFLVFYSWFGSYARMICLINCSRYFPLMFCLSESKHNKKLNRTRLERVIPVSFLTFNYIGYSTSDLLYFLVCYLINSTFFRLKKSLCENEEKRKS